MPSLLKPMRLITAKCSGTRNRRGFGLPLCGRGVTVPISIKPKPKAAKPSIYSPFLSKPAAKPTGLGRCSPISVVGDVRGFTFGSRPMRSAQARLFSVRPCAVSGANLKINGRNKSYIMKGSLQKKAYFKRYSAFVADSRVKFRLGATPPHGAGCFCVRPHPQNLPERTRP